MRNLDRLLIGVSLAAALAALTGPAFAQAPAAQHNMPNMPPPASGAKVIVSDPTSVVMIVDRDSNDIAFMDIKTKQILGRTFLGNNVNPHMVMMSPDGRYVVTGGQRSNTAYIIDSRTLELVAKIPVGFAPEHLAFSPDGRWYYQGNPEGDSITVIDMQSLKAIKTIEGLHEPLNITFTPDGSKAYIGNYGAHWVGVVDVTRHELIKKINIDTVPGVARLDPAKYLSEIKGIFNATPTPDGRFLYAADGDLGVVGVIDTREDKIIKVIDEVLASEPPGYARFPDRRIDVIKWLTELKGATEDEVIERVTPYVTDFDENVRFIAIDGLSSRDPKKYVDTLVDALVRPDEESGRIRRTIIEVLERTKAPLGGRAKDVATMLSDVQRVGTIAAWPRGPDGIARPGSG